MKYYIVIIVDRLVIISGSIAIDLAKVVKYRF